MNHGYDNQGRQHKAPQDGQGNVLAHMRRLPVHVMQDGTHKDKGQGRGNAAQHGTGIADKAGDRNVQKDNGHTAQGAP